MNKFIIAIFLNYYMRYENELLFFLISLYHYHINSYFVLFHTDRGQKERYHVILTEVNVTDQNIKRQVNSRDRDQLL